MATLLDEALACVARGWPVFPCQTARPGDNKSGKKPIVEHGLLEATTDAGAVERWWDRWPDANIGLPAGEALGAWVLDVDGERGSDSLTQLEAELGPLPITREVATGGGGRHLYFQWPKGQRVVRNRQNLRPGIDVRGEGGYVIAPPSNHYTGGTYSWLTTATDPLVEAPEAWFDFVCPPPPPKRAPWEQVDPATPVAGITGTAPAPVIAGGRMPLMERARLYLREADPAVQGSGGHNKLLWAARCLVVGFELDETTALALLWSDYNPRCVPPWRQDLPSDVKDFERKVHQAKTTPAGKAAGWLLDEFGFSRDDEAIRAIGNTSAAALLESAKLRAEVAPETILEPSVEVSEAPLLPSARRDFPIELFPDKIRDFCQRVSEAHNVDTSFACLPVLTVAGAAMGNAWRLALKRGFEVAPIVWCALVAHHGQNKSGPLKQVMEPLRRTLSGEEVGDPLLNPQGRVVVSDATLEAVVQRLSESRRGLLNFRDELAGWVNSFGQFKKGGGGDEQAWLEFWGGGHYVVDRKTQNEQIHIPAASVSVLGGIQPKTLQKCFDPSRFDSGFVPRVLIACPPQRASYWNDAEVDPLAEDQWQEAITWLRCTPFVGQDVKTQHFLPRRLTLADDVRTVYTTFFDNVSAEMRGPGLDANAQGFLAKARTQAARLALIHHGLRLACGSRDLDEPVLLESVSAGCSWARWCLEEQLRVYGYTSVTNARERAEELLAALKTRCQTSTASARQVVRLNTRRYPDNEAAQAAMGLLVEQGLAKWVDATKEKVTW